MITGDGPFSWVKRRHAALLKAAEEAQAATVLVNIEDWYLLQDHPDAEKTADAEGPCLYIYGHCFRHKPPAKKLHGTLDMTTTPEPSYEP